MTISQRKVAIENLMNAIAHYLYTTPSHISNKRHILKMVPLMGIVASGLNQLNLQDVQRARSRQGRVLFRNVWYKLSYDHTIPRGKPSLHRGGIAIENLTTGKVVVEIYNFDTALAFAAKPASFM